MAEIPHFLQESPGWRAGGVEPPNDFKASGYVAGYKPPAGFFNWFWTRVSVCISELQNKLRPYMQENEYEKAQLTKQLYVRTVGMESTVTGTVQDIALPDGMDIADIRGIPIRVGGAGDGKSTAPATSNVSLRVNGEFSAPLLLPAPGYRRGIPPSEGMPGIYIFTEGYTQGLPEGWSDFGYTATLTQVPEWEEGLTEPTQYFDAFVMERAPRMGEVVRGANENGEYIKFSDGTLVCTKNINVESYAMTGSSGGSANLYAGPPIDISGFAYDFVGAPQISVNGYATSGATLLQARAGRYNWIGMRTIAGTYRVVVEVIAVGRWK